MCSIVKDSATHLNSNYKRKLTVTDSSPSTIIAVINESTLSYFISAFVKLHGHTGKS